MNRIAEEALLLEIVNVPTLIFRTPHRTHKVHLNGRKLDGDPKVWYSLPCRDDPFEFNLNGDFSNVYTYNVGPLARANNAINADGNQIQIKPFQIPSAEECVLKEELNKLYKEREKLIGERDNMEKKFRASEAKMKEVKEILTTQCSICQCLVVNAVTVPCKSKHVFCEKCLDDYFEAKLKDQVSASYFENLFCKYKLLI